jgi:hypothetical protein
VLGACVGGAIAPPLEAVLRCYPTVITGMGLSPEAVERMRGAPALTPRDINILMLDKEEDPDYLLEVVGRYLPAFNAINVATAINRWVVVMMMMMRRRRRRRMMMVVVVVVVVVMMMMMMDHGDDDIVVVMLTDTPVMHPRHHPMLTQAPERHLNKFPF